jgi:hypothetical protein
MDYPRSAICLLGRDGSVGIATRYWLDGPGVESWWDEIFHIRPDRPWGLTSLLYNGYRGLSFGGGGQISRGVALTTHPI